MSKSLQYRTAINPCPDIPLFRGKEQGAAGRTTAHYRKKSAAWRWWRQLYRCALPAV